MLIVLSFIITDNELRQLAQEVLELLKSTIGTDLFSQQYAMVHQILAERRGTRKLNKAQQVYIFWFFVYF